MMVTNSKSCFVIAPIGKENSSDRKRSDQVFKHIIAPAAAACGYEAIRADNLSKPGLITSQIIEHLVTDQLVIADLTGHNPNVFYELAIRHVVKKPVVQIIQTTESIPFDVASTRTVQFDHRDLDSAVQGRDEIIRQIRAVESNPEEVDTPISVAIDLKFLRESNNPLEKSNAEIMALLQQLKQGIEKIVQRDNEAEVRRKQMEWIDEIALAFKGFLPALKFISTTPEIQRFRQLGAPGNITAHTAPDGRNCPGTQGVIIDISPAENTVTLRCSTCSGDLKCQMAKEIGSAAGVSGL